MSEQSQERTEGQLTAHSMTEMGVCSFCGDQLQHVTVYEHSSCGKVGGIEAFRSEDGICCPKCEFVSADASSLEEICTIIACAGCTHRTDTVPATLTDADDSLTVD